MKAHSGGLPAAATWTTATCDRPSGWANTAGGHVACSARGAEAVAQALRTRAPSRRRSPGERAMTLTPAGMRRARACSTVRSGMCISLGTPRTVVTRCSRAAASTASHRAIVSRLSRPLISGSVPSSTAHKQLGHRADEGVGEPDLVPARLDASRRRVACVREVERARRPGRVARPADRAAGQPVGPFDPPADADVAGRPLAGRAGPDVVPRRGPAPVVVLEDVQVDAVVVRELSSAGRAGCWPARGRACRASSGTCRGGGCS